MPDKPKDLPVAELLALGRKTAEQFPGATVWFKFTCPKCGERCIFEEPNTLYEIGECAACGHAAPVTEGGFNLEIPL